MLNNFLGEKDGDGERERERWGGGVLVDRFTSAMSPKYAILYNKNDFISYHLHQRLGR